MITFLLKGFGLGFSIAAPVGPIGVLCIRRTLAHGRRVGLSTGLGAAAADAIYGCVAAFGLTAVSEELAARQTMLRLVGGGFLCWLGVRTLLAKPPAASGETRQVGALGAFASTFVLTLTNPMTIISFAAAFAALGLGREAAGLVDAASMVAGVFAGSAAWWLILSTAVGLMRRQVSPRVMIWVNRLSGLVILGFGVAALASVFWKG